MMIERIEKTGLLALMVAGGLALFAGVPAGVLWGLGEVVDTKSQHLLLGIPAVVLGMILCGIALAALNRAYLRLDGAERRPGERRRGGPLEAIVAACAAAAILGFFAWMVFGTDGTAPLW